MFGLFKRGIDIESGVFHQPGFYQSGESPRIGEPMAEIYSLSAADDELSLWWLDQQEKLSRAVRWKDDYFQIWAEILAFGHAGEWLVPERWVIVGYDRSGKAVSSVDYTPRFDKQGVLIDVVYRDSTTERLACPPLSEAGAS